MQGRRELRGLAIGLVTLSLLPEQPCPIPDPRNSLQVDENTS